MGQVPFRYVNLGCDPEFFISRGKKIIGSEEVIEKNGLGCHEGKIVIDGVQAEINPLPSTCRAILGNEIARCLNVLRKSLKEKGKNLRANFSQIVDISPGEFKTLSENAKKFGCAPSHNIHTAARSKIKVDPKVYRKRSAGGHIHLGSSYATASDVLDDIKNMVPILDCVLGNTCVLIDRDPGNIERRKVYGRAGEYRKPGSGRLEYRTLSNFWLTSYQLMSLVMGLARFAVNIVESKRSNEILELINIKDIQNAINKNDFNLAYRNFKKLESKLLEMAGNYHYDRPFTVKNIDAFHWFIKQVKAKGLTHFFPKDPLEHWSTMPEGHDRGWEKFLEKMLNKMKKEEEKKENKEKKAKKVKKVKK